MKGLIMKRRSLISKILVISLLLSFIVPINSTGIEEEQLSEWEWRNPLPTGNNLNDILYEDENDLYVAVGDLGTIITSEDGKEWSNLKTEINNQLSNVAYGNGRFVAVGDGIIMTSEDGEHWVKYWEIDSYEQEDYDLHLKEVVYGNGKFIGIGHWTYNNQSSHIILSSDDGLSWRLKEVTAELEAIAYGNNRFVAVGMADDRGYASLLSSNDGESWTSRTSNVAYDLTGVLYGEGKFVAYGQNGAVYSQDGFIWSQGTGDHENLHGVAYKDYRFIGLDSDDSIVISYDGEVWYKQRTNLLANALAAGKNQLLAVGDSGTIATSSDGINWAEETAADTTSFSHITYGNNKFVAFTTDGIVYYSRDGVDWKKTELGYNSYIYEAVYAENKYVAVGSDGNVLTSYDGVAWTERYSNSDIQLYDITYAEGKFVMVGSNGIIKTSTNGLYWNTINLDSTIDLYTIGYGDNKFIAVSNTDDFYISNDGYSWTKKTSEVAKNILDITYGNGRFVALTSSEQILISEDGYNWREIEIDDSLSRFIYGKNQFVAVGYDGAIKTSRNGLTWVNSPSNTSNHLTGIAYGAGSYVAVGGNTTILQNILTTEQLTVQSNYDEGIYNKSLAITLTSSNPAKIYYTLNGDTPNRYSHLYHEPIILDGDEGGKVTLKYVAIDEHGDKSEVYSQSYIVRSIDDINELSLNGSLGERVWFTSDVTISFEEVAGEPIKYSFNQNYWFEYERPFILSSEGVRKLYYYNLNDHQVEEQLIKIDKTNPLISISSPMEDKEYDLDAEVTASWEVTDRISGVHRSIGTVESGEEINTASEGVKYFEVSAVDEAGNKAVEKVQYAVRDTSDDDGDEDDDEDEDEDALTIEILPPLGKDKTFKQGRVIPVKFRLTGGDIDDDMEARLFVGKVEDGKVKKEYKAPSPGNSNKGNLFKQDKRNRLFNFNLNTKALSKGKWRLRIELDDHHSAYVYINLR